jgi:hypothetical protein
MKVEPLFIRYANGLVGAEEIVNSFLESNFDKRSEEIAKEALKKLPDLALFKRDFCNLLLDIIDNGIRKPSINYVNDYMKPSLEEIVEGSSASRSGEKRQIIIKAKDTPWIEAIVCYNLCLYIKMFGFLEIKHCPVCGKFFSHKGKYAKYCSDICKGPKNEKKEIH